MKSFFTDTKKFTTEVTVLATNPTPINATDVAPTPNAILQPTTTLCPIFANASVTDFIGFNEFIFSHAREKNPLFFSSSSLFLSASNLCCSSACNFSILSCSAAFSACSFAIVDSLSASSLLLFSLPSAVLIFSLISSNIFLI